MDAHEYGSEDGPAAIDDQNAYHDAAQLGDLFCSEDAHVLEDNRDLGQHEGEIVHGDSGPESLEEQLNVVYRYSLKRYSKSTFNLVEDDNAESDGSSHSCCHDIIIWTSILEHDNSRVKPTNDNNECNTGEKDAANHNRDISTRNCEPHDERRL